jgi:hypothetical protein
VMWMEEVIRRMTLLWFTTAQQVTGTSKPTGQSIWWDQQIKEKGNTTEELCDVETLMIIEFLWIRSILFCSFREIRDMIDGIRFVDQENTTVIPDQWEQTVLIENRDRRGTTCWTSYRWMEMWILRPRKSIWSNIVWEKVIDIEYKVMRLDFEILGSCGNINNNTDEADVDSVSSDSYSNKQRKLCLRRKW